MFTDLGTAGVTPPSIVRAKTRFVKLKGLTDGEQLLIEFTPQGRAPRIARFNIRGLFRHLDYPETGTRREREDRKYWCQPSLPPMRRA